MPFLLNSICGGLGNQMFIITSLIAFAEKYDTTFYFDIPDEDIQGVNIRIPVYKSLLNIFKKHNKYNDSEYRLYPSVKIFCKECQPLTMPIDIDYKKTTIEILGLPMYYYHLEPSLITISNLLLEESKKYIEKEDNLSICIGFRSFEEEKLLNNFTPVSYYSRALLILLDKISYDTSKPLIIYCYTDKYNYGINIITNILKDMCFNIKYVEIVGKRDINTSVRHFFSIFNHDHYILTNSTFHYWGALFSNKNKDKIVLYPNRENNLNKSWMESIVSPSWLAV
jgi:hypothetical protein